MTEYVEAGYALAVLKDARLKNAADAKRLIIGFLRECAPAIHADSSARTDAIVASRGLRDVLGRDHTIEERAWKDALEALQRWKESA